MTTEEKDRIASRLDWIKDRLLWLGPEGAQQQIEMLIADILRGEKEDDNA